MIPNLSRRAPDALLGQRPAGPSHLPGSPSHLTVPGNPLYAFPVAATAAAGIGVPEFIGAQRHPIDAGAFFVPASSAMAGCAAQSQDWPVADVPVRQRRTVRLHLIGVRGDDLQPQYRSPS